MKNAAMKALISNSGVVSALEYIKQADEITLKEQLEMVVIPAPSYYEQAKGKYVYDKFLEIGLEDVHVDEVGNVLGSIKGSCSDSCVVLAAHLDTVFPMETDLTIRREGKRIYCPGINDDTRAVAELLTIARAMKHAGLKGEKDIVFCANVCEEGLGDLRGVKHLFASRKDIASFVSVDNQHTGAIIYIATGSRRYKVVFSGPGGHSYGDFGIANPIHAMGRAIAKIAEFKVPDEPRTTFNVGVVSGGTSVNTISQNAELLMDIRSTDEGEINKLCTLFKQVINAAVDEENKRWGADATNCISAEIIEVGYRPAGVLPEDSEIIKAAVCANELLGIESILDIASSTDANVPISLGIPGITVGRGGKEYGVHTLEEWFEPEESYLGPQRDLLLILEMSNI